MNEYIKQKRNEAPTLISKQEWLVTAYKMALKNLLEINTVSCPTSLYNKSGLIDETLGLMIRAGGGYDTPWTRDASVNTMNAACFLEPEVAKNTLWAVCERVDGKLCFQMDNQCWDKVIWATGAWNYFLATGDMEFLSNAFETIQNSMEILEETRLNTKYGLFTGGSFFNDGITGYPKDLHLEGKESSFVGEHPATEHIMSFSTNCLYYNAYVILSKIDKSYEGKAKKLKETLNQVFWNEENHRYAYLLYPDGRLDLSQEGCGISFAILFDVCDKERAKRMLQNCYRGKYGLMSIWPPFEGLSSIEKPIRHNNLIWQVVNGFFIPAAAKCGDTTLVGSELYNMAQLAIKNHGFWEIYNPDTGIPDGGWQVGCHWDSVHDQTWSATGFISSIVFGIFGIKLQENSIEFKPCLPKELGEITLQGIHFRDVVLNIHLKGSGSVITSIKINGELTQNAEILYEKKGTYHIEIELE